MTEKTWELQRPPFISVTLDGTVTKQYECGFFVTIDAAGDRTEFHTDGRITWRGKTWQGNPNPAWPAWRRWLFSNVVQRWRRVRHDLLRRVRRYIKT